MTRLFDLQGHRGARGLKPENTLPSFEAALDVGVSSIETDVHLTRDGVPVVVHDAILSEYVCRLRPGSSSPAPQSRPAVSSLAAAALRGYQADRNPDPARFASQDAAATPLAILYGRLHDLDPFTLPMLADLFAFVAAYAGPLGTQAGKTPSQQERGGRLVFDLELKRVPFRPHLIGDDFLGDKAGLLEQQVVAEIRRAGLVARTIVRSFDHLSVRVVRDLEPGLGTAVLVSGTAPVSPAQLAQQAGAGTYCPDFQFLDQRQVRQLHTEGLRVVPWTVNDPADWECLVGWGVDGITSDYPDRLAAWLKARGVKIQ